MYVAGAHRWNRASVPVFSVAPPVAAGMEPTCSHPGSPPPRPQRSPHDCFYFYELDCFEHLMDVDSVSLFDWLTSLNMTSSRFILVANDRICVFFKPW